VASDEQTLLTLPELGEGESTVSPARFVIAERPDGTPTLDVVEGGFEQRYRVGDSYAGLLFVALCDAHGARAYRRQRLHQGTVCVHTTVSKHDALWKQFLQLSRQLDVRLYDVTQQFVHEQVERTSK
jgi:hypothetical protein